MQFKITVWYDYIPPRMLKIEKTWTRMFTVALFVIAPNWKQFICPLAGEWMNKLPCIHMVEYYPAIKRNGLVTFFSMLEESQNQYIKWKPRDSNKKSTLYYSIYIKLSKSENFSPIAEEGQLLPRKRVEIVRRGRQGSRWVTRKLWGVLEIFINLIVVGV